MVKSWKPYTSLLTISCQRCRHSEWHPLGLPLRYGLAENLQSKNQRFLLMLSKSQCVTTFIDVTSLSFNQYTKPKY